MSDPETPGSWLAAQRREWIGRGLDVLVSAVALLVFVRFENSRARIPGRWFSLIAVVTVGVSLALPLFLYLRERALEQSS